MRYPNCQALAGEAAVYEIEKLSSNNLNRKGSIISFIVQIIATFAVWIDN